ncbi:MAG: SUMF1/EgtB/PvdO family nonheme iron enzyme [Pseudomonadota bacterium]|nr:SUMF1/EgtB/PvdO family nonheme iron enzyme [Pseudomonadota bacterium]
MNSQAFSNPAQQQRRRPRSGHLNLANHAAFFNQICAVGCFPCGGSPYGCRDMIGNVWEWTRSRFGGYPYPDNVDGRREREDLGDSGQRVLRGGPSRPGDDLPRCGSRWAFNPFSSGFIIGFRVVLSPFL